MNKNTVWAIVLSTLVLVVFTFLQPIINPIKTIEPAKTQVEEVVSPVVVEAVEKSFENSEPLIGEVDDLLDTYFIEENFNITTNKVNVTFTNRGGDIIGYELLDHKDGENFVQMADMIFLLRKLLMITQLDFTNLTKSQIQMVRNLLLLL